MMKRSPTKKAGSSFILSTDPTDNPKLGAKVLTNGNQSLWIEYYLGYDKETAKKSRSREFLKLYLIGAPKTPAERLQNKETLELAKRIRFEKEQQLKNEVEQRGWQWVDWNVCAEDAVGGHPSADTIYRNVVRETGEQTHCVVLMHDSATTRTTAEALPDIIRWYTDNGYTFLTVAEALPLG